MIYNILVLGAGGTGSYFLKEFARFASSMLKVHKGLINIALCDGDRVEEKNLERQAFFEDSISKYKASDLAMSINECFGMEVASINKYITSVEQLGEIFDGMIKSHSSIYGRNDYLNIIVGCVDNHAARQVCEDFFKRSKTCFYFDSANEFSYGEVVFGVKVDNVIKSPCRSFYFPEVLKPTKAVTEMSCSELNEVAPQHIATNMRAGNILLSAMTKLIQNKKISTGMVTFDVFEFTEEYYPYKNKVEGKEIKEKVTDRRAV